MKMANLPNELNQSSIKFLFTTITLLALGYLSLVNSGILIIYFWVG